MQIGYVCTNYNNSEITAKAVATLKANGAHFTQTVIVDNASSIEEMQKLVELADSDVDVLCLRENVGYFRGLNAGIERLRKNHPEIKWIVIGNNDIEFPADFCDKLEGLSDDLKSHPVVSPDIVTGDGEHQNPHVISHISKVREFVYDLYYSNYHVGMLIQALAQKFPRVSDRSDETHWQEARHIHQGHGSVYILGPRFFELFEELWAPTFMMSEEFFLSKQLGDVGEKVYYDPRLQIRHLWHASLAQLPSRKRWEMARDAHNVYRKYKKLI